MLAARMWIVIHCVQGVISPTLANMTLDGLEQLLKVAFRRRRDGNKQYRLKVNLIRYADDFIITGPTRDVLENEVQPLVEQFLRDRGLQLSPEKTCITHIDEAGPDADIRTSQADGLCANIGIPSDSEVGCSRLIPAPKHRPVKSFG